VTLYPTLLWLALVALPPDAEIGAWATLRGVPVDVARAIASAETGNVAEPRLLRSMGNKPHRDNIIAQGGVGRMQVNPSVQWKRLGYRSRSEAVRALQNRHVNIYAGVLILAAFQRRYEPLTRSIHDCRCGRPHSWTAHYNGSKRMDSYGRRVVRKVELARYGNRRDW